MRQKQCIRFSETAMSFIFSRPLGLAQPASEFEASYCGFVVIDRIRN